jgi:hypothetical protein
MVTVVSPPTAASDGLAAALAAALSAGGSARLAAALSAGLEALADGLHAARARTAIATQVAPGRCRDPGIERELNIRCRSPAVFLLL